ncbi:unnamed protein product [Symbiodinium microadriaticum]|nr:unnamed protein product [Symbiodinium sp. KB8]CAE7866267.1 unnamed protein product [Symbiodinium microadriaticum]
MRNRVSIIVGGTGCGKSTQVPQFIIQEAQPMLALQSRADAGGLRERSVLEHRDLRSGF